ncbi:FAD-dependent monooxygenase [Rhodobacteraceae bacterium F11138]|nr:FAD-dependent monooxygenase [Rhodobacteraceae bacterium F11138]
MTYDVAIVGAGPVGLMLACELGQHGISVGIFDAGSPDSPGHPRANNQSARSMEYYRRLGIVEELRASGLPENYPTDATYLAGFNGMEIARVSLPSKQEALRVCRAGDPVWKSAEPQLRTSQRSLTPLLARRLRDFKTVELFENVEVTQVTAGDGVQLRLDNDTGVQARFCVGCDGARSMVRKAMGIRLGGEDGLDMDFMGGRMIASYFSSPNLVSLTGMQPAWQYWAILPDIRAVMVTLDGDEEFILHRQLPKGQEPATYELQADLDRLCGPGVEVQIFSSAAWRAGQALVSSSFREGPLMIAGDSAHLFTPTGGMGLNTGIEDAINLAWKLAEVVKGRAGDTLLDSYTQERRKIALRNTGYALKLARAVGECPVAPAIADAGPEGDAARMAAREHILKYARNEFEHPGIGLGGRYDDSALIVPNGTPPADHPISYQPSTVPGGRLPHVWLDDNESLLDLAGYSFTLVDFDAALPVLPATWCEKMSVAVHRLDRADLAGELGARAVLVRPDQIIAWRCTDAGDVTRAELENALNVARARRVADHAREIVQ